MHDARNYCMTVNQRFKLHDHNNNLQHLGQSTTQQVLNSSPQALLTCLTQVKVITTQITLHGLLRRELTAWLWRTKFRVPSSRASVCR